MPALTLLGPSKTERMVRTAPKGSVRAVQSPDGRPVIRLQVVQYKVVDSYRTVFLPGCMTRSITKHMPQLTWGHNWADTIGRAFEIISDNPDEGPIVDFYLDDFDAVPRAKQAYAQVQSGTIDECSIGFGWDYEWHKPSDEEMRLYPGAEEMITEIDWDETALVLRGAVPGAKVVPQYSLRSRPLTRSQKWIDEEVAAQIVLKFVNPDVEFSLTDALVELRESAVERPGPEAEQTDKEVETKPSEGDIETPAALAEGEDQGTETPEVPAETSTTTDEPAGGEDAPNEPETETPSPVETPEQAAQAAAETEALDAEVEAALALVGGK